MSTKRIFFSVNTVVKRSTQNQVRNAAQYFLDECWQQYSVSHDATQSQPKYPKKDSYYASQIYQWLFRYRCNTESS